MLLYGGPPRGRGGRVDPDIVRRFEEMERATRDATDFFRGRGLSATALDAVRAGLVLDFAIPSLVLP